MEHFGAFSASTERILATMTENSSLPWRKCLFVNLEEVITDSLIALCPPQAIFVHALGWKRLKW
jgi:hypothetical protein